MLSLAPTQASHGQEGALTWVWAACGSPGGSSSSGMWGMAAAWLECLEPLLCQPQRCSKRLGLCRLGRCQKDKSNSFPSLSQGGFHFQDPRATDELFGSASTLEVRRGEAGSRHWELHCLLLSGFVYMGRGDLLHLIWSLQ